MPQKYDERFWVHSGPMSHATAKSKAKGFRAQGYRATIYQESGKWYVAKTRSKKS